MRAVAQIEQPAHRVLGHAELFGELELRPTARAHGLVDGELCGHERGQHGAVAPSVGGALSRQPPAGFHIAFERRDDAIDRVGARLLFAFAFGQCFGYPPEADEPPAVLLSLQFVTIPKGHSHSSKSALVRPSCASIAFPFADLSGSGGAVVKAPVAAFPVAGIKRNGDSALPSDPSDSSLKFAPRHAVISHIYVRIPRCPDGLDRK